MRGAILLFAFFAGAILATACGAEQPANGAIEDLATAEATESAAESTTAALDAEVRAGDGEARAGNAFAGNAFAGDGEARAGNIVAGGGKVGGAEAAAGVVSPAVTTGKARIRISGTPGTEFSGRCAVGGEEQEIGGRTPERFVYRLDGKKLECSIQVHGSGVMRVVLVGDGTRAVQRINAGLGSVNLTYSSSGVSVTTR